LARCGVSLCNPSYLGGGDRKDSVWTEKKGGTLGIWKIPKAKRAGLMPEVAEHPSSEHRTLSSNSTTTHPMNHTPNICKVPCPISLRSTLGSHKLLSLPRACTPSWVCIELHVGTELFNMWDTHRWENKGSWVKGLHWHFWPGKEMGVGSPWRSRPLDWKPIS
jgi:hypothetical protein